MDKRTLPQRPMVGEIEMYGDRQYCNKYGCDWVVHHHVEDEWMGELTVYECKRCGARQAKWCNTWKK